MKGVVLALVIAAVLMAAPAVAQNIPPAPTDAYLIQVTQNGVPVKERAVQLTEWACGQKPKTPPVNGPVINPRTVRIDDPADRMNADCVLDLTGWFNELPTGTGYRALLYATTTKAQPPNDKSTGLTLLPDFQKTSAFGPPVMPTGGRLYP